MGISRREAMNGSLAILGAALTAPPAWAGPDVTVLRVRLGGDGKRTRLVIDADGPLSAPAPRASSAARVVEVAFAARPPQTPQGQGAGLVQRWALSQGPAGQTRLTATLSAAARIERAFLLPPQDGVLVWRYVIDLVPLLQAPRLRRVVIDPGHGGGDTGALGVMACEKDVTLAAALLLRDILADSGDYQAFLTRSDDRFVSLTERRRAAGALKGDLFLSMHADASLDPEVRGASAYTMSDHGAERAMAGFAMASLGAQEMGGLLLDLRQRALRNHSAVFAERLLTRVSHEAPLLRRSHREAGFMVLLGLEAPAALFEMGFITNRLDEQRLTDPARQALLMSSVKLAIDDHFAALPSQLASTD